METIQEGDFVEIEYTGRVKDTGFIFDTTSETVAKQYRMYNPDVNYGPITLCVGKGLVLSGLDKGLLGKEIGKEVDIEVGPQAAFGKKNPKLLKLVPAMTFKKHNIKPEVGLQVTIDNSIGVIKSISGGRVIVDFNHPLSGKELVYHVSINNKVTDVKEQVSWLLTLKLNLKKDNFSVVIKDDVAEVELIGLPKIPSELSDMVIAFVTENTSIKNVIFKQEDSSSKK